MNQTRVFISYTSRDECSKNISRTLFECLNGAGFAAWRDVERLQHGEKWHAALTKNLVGSHAGVVLLTPEALASEWVLKEATYLKVRADGSPDFKVVVVLLEGLAPSDLTADTCAFKVLHFPEDQLIRLSDADVPDAVLKALDDVKALWEATRPEDRLIEDITLKLEPLHEKILLRLARELHLKLDDWFPDGSMQQTLARELARLMAASEPAAVARIIGSEIAGHLEKEGAESILKYILPFQVDGEGARQLAAVVRTIPPGAAGLNAKDPKIGLLYMCRASGRLNGWRRVQVNGVCDPEGTGTDLVDQVRQALMQKWALLEAEELQDYLADLQEPYFVLIPSVVEERALRKLRTELKELCILVLSEHLHPDSPLCLSKLLRFLAPPLVEDTEVRILKGYRRACRELTEYYDALADFK